MNKKTVSITILVILILLSLATLLVIKNNRSIVDPRMQYVGFSDESIPFTFNYPDTWTYELSLSENRDAAQDIITLYSEDKNFLVEFRSTRGTEPIDSGNCSEDVPCGVVSPRVYYQYQEGSFEEVAEIEGFPVLVSVSGINDYELVNDQDRLYFDDDSYSDGLQEVFQKDEEGITPNMNVLGHDNNQDYLNIYYQFKSEDSFDKWESYKEILTDLINSLSSAN